ncbi:hypothetical protein SAMN05421781_0908 [Marinococcus luteus]|uniref:CNNM transmembrane domain-containing protein n=1 Tax=Marinococcus luteus TaxID=1122204 RepID=A0A1H2RTD2_9BACI|nr:hypothetical protein [Marinococcus luteus]SDW22732.1 hypothetical protein SAMN05421781_0908 [Marinococcus luteus]
MNSLWKKSLRWSTLIGFVTLILAAIFSVVSTAVLSGVGWAIGMVVVLIIVFTGVIFDVIGVAATAAKPRPFNAMAAKKVPGASHSVFIQRNADRVANFCADVIGDISGVVSGTASSAVVVQLGMTIGTNNSSNGQLILSTIFTAVVAALTVSGKALGKTLAITYANNIVFQVGRILYFIENKLKIKLIPKKRRWKSSTEKHSR